MDPGWCWPQMDSLSLIRRASRRTERLFLLTTGLFSFPQNRKAAEIGPSVLDTGDTEEMDVQPIKGKSFISVDPLGQVDWSWAFWFGFYFAFFLPQSPHCSPQLQQTEKVMGLRFCPDKGVRTLSLLLTPLSHHWDRDGGGGGAHWGTVSQSLPPSSCLKPSATELPPASLYPIPKPAADGWWTQSSGGIFTTYCLIKCKQGTAEAYIFLDRGSRWKALKGYLSCQAALTASAE